jgi:hypothetical protein
MHKGVVVVLILVAVTAGCMGPGSQTGNGGGEGGGSGQASVSFTERTPDAGGPTRIAIQVESLGTYDFMWVEADGVEGGYKMNQSSRQPGVYIADNGVTTFGFGICYKESLTAECGMYSGDPTNFNPSVEVYGVEGGEKTLVDEYSLE